MVIMIIAGVLAIIIIPLLAFNRIRPGRAFFASWLHTYHESKFMRILDWIVDGGK